MDKQHTVLVVAASPDLACLLSLLLSSLCRLAQDLKPSNLLFSSRGCLKLGDFGLARVHAAQSRDAAYSHEVATRWYRSVELLYGARSYGFEVDVWSVGAVFFEMINGGGGGSPLFPGQNDIDQLYRVLKIRGTPTEKNWPGYTLLPDWGKIDFPAMEAVPLQQLCHPEVPAAAVDLLEQMLCLDPQRRITAQRALEHPYFSEYRAHDAAVANGGPAAASIADQPWHEEMMVCGAQRTMGCSAAAL